MTITLYILTFLSALIPTSLLVSLNIPKLLYKISNNLSKTTTICTTIPGILTKDPTEVKTIIFDKFIASAAPYADQSNELTLFNKENDTEIKLKKTDLQKEPAINLMAQITTLCNYEKMQKLESVVSHLFKTCAIDLKKIQEENQVLAKIPSGESKKISTIVSFNNQSKEIFALSKGNPYKILEKCTRELINDKKLEIDAQRRHKLKKRIEKLNKNGQKVIAFAYKALPLKRLDHYSETFAETDLVLIGFIGLAESINTELIPYIEELKKNHIRLHILTGTKEKKAVAVATQLKVINPNHFESITGRDLTDINNQKLQKLLGGKDKDYVFCEIGHRDRARITHLLEQNGETVTFTSKKHNHGIKELLEAIDKSRKNKRNRGKLIFHALNCKITELLLLIAAVILKSPLPLTILLILTIDILFNVILELSINTEKSTANFIEEEKILNTRLIINIVSSTIIVGGIYFWNLVRLGWYPGETILNPDIQIKSSTMAFILICLLQITNAYQARNKEKSILKLNPLSNIYLILTIIVCLLMIKIITTYEFFQNYLSIGDLSINEWQIIFFGIFISILIEEVRKFIIRKNENHHPPEQLPAHQSHS